MKILAIDSSSLFASAAILETPLLDDIANYKVIGHIFSGAQLTHSQTLMPMVNSILRDTSTNINEIDLFAVSAGPGSFTGLRIGISAVKGMALALNKPCIPISTLYSMAFNLQYDSKESIVCAAMDARCNQVYAALFACSQSDDSSFNVGRLTKDEAITLPDLVEKLRTYDNRINLVGDGAILCYNAIRQQNMCKNIYLVSENLRHQNAVSVGIAAIHSIHLGVNTVTSGELLPMYLKLPQATRELKKKLEKGGVNLDSFGM